MKQAQLEINVGVGGDGNAVAKADSASIYIDGEMKNLVVKLAKTGVRPIKAFVPQKDLPFQRWVALWEDGHPRMALKEAPPMTVCVEGAIDMTDGQVNFEDIEAVLYWKGKNVPLQFDPFEVARFLVS